MQELAQRPENGALRLGWLSVIIRVSRPSFLGLTHNRRPGILVLINDADWELEGGEQYQLQANDRVLFVSTLHGG